MLKTASSKSHLDLGELDGGTGKVEPAVERSIHADARVLTLQTAVVTSCRHGIYVSEGCRREQGDGGRMGGVVIVTGDQGRGVQGQTGGPEPK